MNVNASIYARSFTEMATTESFQNIYVRRCLRDADVLPSFLRAPVDLGQWRNTVIIGLLDDSPEYTTRSYDNPLWPPLTKFNRNAGILQALVPSALQLYRRLSWTICEWLLPNVLCSMLLLIEA